MDPRVGVLVLAAGASTRMGRPKQLLPHRGQSLVRGAVTVALQSECGPVVVVTGANAALVRNELYGLDILQVENPGWESGMASSIHSGLKQLLHHHPDLEAVLITLCDQPHTSGELTRYLVATHRTSQKPIVASFYGNAPGVPALFAASLFPELLALQGPAGARSLFQKYAHQVVLVPFPGGAVDVDTPQDYQALQAAAGVAA